MTETLLPCPFCGGEGCIQEHVFVGYISTFGVVCLDCCAETRQFFNTKDEAIAAWNRRTQPENEPLTLDELRQMDGCNDDTPIWIEPTGKYEGVWTAAWYIWPWDTKDFEIDTYADAWLAYRAKPKEEHHEDD